MHGTRTVPLCITPLTAAFLFALVSCSQPGSGTTNSDASHESGGPTATGGVTGTGGGTGIGGAPASGGAIGTGGVTEIDGGFATGGATGTGGAAATGGATATDGGMGTDGGAGVREGGATDGNPVGGDGSAGIPALGAIIGTPVATFDSNASGFTLNTFAEIGNLANLPSPATLTWISTDGSPNPGCLKITAPYSGPNQWVDIEAAAFPAPRNWSGRTLHVRIKLDPSSMFSGFARLYVKTGTAFVFYTSAFTPYPQNSGWQEFVLPLVSPAPVPPANPGADPAQVVTFGVDPITAGAPPTTPTPVTFYVDSFSIE